MANVTGRPAGTAVRRPQQPLNKRQKPQPKKELPPKKKPRKQKEKDPNRVRLFYTAGSIDIPMLVIALVLLIIGITMMFSASHALSYRDNQGDSYGYAMNQLRFALIGLGLMALASIFDYRLLRKEFKFLNTKYTFSFATILMIIAFTLTALVLVFGVSNIENGPRRWLPIGSISFQPSDVLKLALIVYLGYYISKHFQRMRYTVVGLINPMIMLIGIGYIMYKQPHLSGLLIMLMIAGCMLVVGGVNLKTVGFAGIIGALLLVAGMMFSEFSYFQDRIRYTFDPLAAPLKETYQSYQSVLAVGSGGFWGVGFGNSTQKYYYLPEAQNDFVYAVLCEEFGFVGGLLVIILFMIFVFRAFYIARKSEDRFGMLLATGIGVHFGLQALLNIGVNVCVVPNTGISMPFFSYGGTALVLQLVEVGLLLSVSRRAKLN